MQTYRFFWSNMPSDKARSRALDFDNDLAAVVTAQNMSNRTGYDIEVWHDLALVGRLTRISDAWGQSKDGRPDVFSRRSQSYLTFAMHLSC